MKKEPMVTLTFSAPPGFKAVLKARAARRGMTVPQLVRGMLEWSFAQDDYRRERSPEKPR